MSSLPQRKKSAEEIAQLRESLGVSQHPATAHPSSVIPTTASAPRPSLVPPRSRPEAEDDVPSTALRTPKPVRSLRKSEQAPVEVQPPAANASTSLPARRHSRQQLEELRRREALAHLDSPPPNPKLMPAHPAWITPGYILGLAGGSCFVFDEFPWAATFACAACALAIALSLYLKRPLSKHHAAFIAVICLLVIVFGSLHHFPQLQHAT